MQKFRSFRSIVKSYKYIIPEHEGEFANWRIHEAIMAVPMGPLRVGDNVAVVDLTYSPHDGLSAGFYKTEPDFDAGNRIYTKNFDLVLE